MESLSFDAYNFKPVTECGEKFLSTWAWSLALSMSTIVAPEESASGCWYGEKDVEVDMDDAERGVWAFKFIIGFHNKIDLNVTNKVLDKILGAACGIGMEFVDLVFIPIVQNDGSDNIQLTQCYVIFSLYDRTGGEEGDISIRNNLVSFYKYSLGIEE